MNCKIRVLSLERLLRLPGEAAVVAVNPFRYVGDEHVDFVSLKIGVVMCCVDVVCEVRSGEAGVGGGELRDAG